MIRTTERFAALFVIVSGLFCWNLGGQGGKRYVPPPLRIYVPFNVGWDGMIETLETGGYQISRQDRGQGFLLTDFRDYISGPLTENHIGKIGERPKLIDGEWVSARYQYEILVELIEEKETVITVNANIEALQHHFLGEKKRVTIPTNGNLEEKLLIEFGQSLFGLSFSLQEPKAGYWEREPVYIPDLEDRIPRVPGPERPR